MVRLLVTGMCALVLCGAGVAEARDTGKPQTHAAKAKKKKPIAKPAASGSASPLQQQGVKNSGWGTGN